MSSLEPDLNFRVKIEHLMGQVPYGQVTTYGDMAGLAGHANASRIVGGIAHYGDPTLPWHRLVNRFGGLASGYHGGREAQQQLLEQEGISCTEFIVDDFKELRWKPNLSSLS
jgi:methylated-DNA-protein-cysteine methyltransferase related protein